MFSVLWKHRIEYLIVVRRSRLFKSTYIWWKKHLNNPHMIFLRHLLVSNVLTNNEHGDAAEVQLRDEASVRSRVAQSHRGDPQRQVPSAQVSVESRPGSELGPLVVPVLLPVSIREDHPAEAVFLPVHRAGHHAHLGVQVTRQRDGASFFRHYRGIRANGARRSWGEKHNFHSAWKPLKDTCVQSSGPFDSASWLTTDHVTMQLVLWITAQL